MLFSSGHEGLRTGAYTSKEDVSFFGRETFTSLDNFLQNESSAKMSSGIGGLSSLDRFLNSAADTTSAGTREEQLQLAPQRSRESRSSRGSRKLDPIAEEHIPVLAKILCTFPKILGVFRRVHVRRPLCQEITRRKTPSNPKTHGNDD